MSQLEAKTLLLSRIHPQRPRENLAMQSLDEFQKCLPFIQSALDKCGNTHLPSDVFEMCKKKLAKLHAGEKSAIVTQILTMPSGRQLHFWLAGGDLDELVKMEKELVFEARKDGIKKVSVIGRAGWLKKLPNYKDAGRILVKDI